MLFATAAVAYIHTLTQKPALSTENSAAMRGMYVTHMRMKEGDDPVWAEAEFNDFDWELRDMRVLRQTTGIVWARQNFLVWPEYIEGKIPAAIFIEGGVSAEIYFNGEFVGRNGWPAENPEQEIAGNIDAKIFVPARLFREGDNVLAVRWSSSLPWQENYEFNVGIRFEAYASERQNRITDYLPSLLLIGAIGAATLYFATSYVLFREDRSALWLALLLFCVLIQFTAELVRGLYSYPYPWHVLRMSTITLMASLSGVFLNLLIAEKFGDIAKVAWTVVACVSVTLVITIRLYGQDTTTYIVLLLSLLLAALQTGRAIVVRQEGARILLASLLLFSLSFLVPMDEFLDGIYYYAMSAFAAALFIWRAKVFETTRRQAASAEARSNRLKLDLLKKQLQPHFIMNTLMALSEWIIESPTTGIKMIQALAAEFRLLHAVSDQTTITVEKELELCRAHLEVMSFKRDQKFKLQTHIEQSQALIPPAVLHTLLENAITHNRYDTPSVRFHINQKIAGNRIFYEVRTPIGRHPSPKLTTSSTKGFGLGYISARMKHLWGSTASLESGQEGTDWVSRLQVPVKQA